MQRIRRSAEGDVSRDSRMATISWCSPLCWNRSLYK